MHSLERHMGHVVRTACRALPVSAQSPDELTGCRSGTGQLDTHCGALVPGFRGLSRMKHVLGWQCMSQNAVSKRWWNGNGPV